jgi:hypothetical protein
MAEEHEQDHAHGIEIRIDHKVYSPPKSRMTGAELRALAQPPIGSDHDLWLESPGPTDDTKVGDTLEIHLKSGMHFYISCTSINPGGADGLA